MSEPASAERVVTGGEEFEMSDAPKKCEHCERPVTLRARGLCFTCHDSKAIRAAYERSRGYWPSEDFYGTAPPPDAPTDAEPGTIYKMDVMGQRAARKQQLFHPQDRRL